MKLDDIKKVAVIGCGVMGAQLAQLLSQEGKFEVSMVGRREERVKGALKGIEDRLERFFVAKGKMTADEKKANMERIEGTINRDEAVRNADFVIETVAEVMSAKKEIFQDLDQKAPPGIILSTNTSTLNITEIASATKRPDKVVGTHYMNPIAVMKLVEVVRGAHTSDETVAVVVALARKLGKEPVVCRDTSYGFLANRPYEALRKEALQMVWEKVASPEDIDKALKLGYNLPMGPLEMGDMMASWGRRAEMEQDTMRELGAEQGRLHPLIRTMVRAGYPGGAGKKGIYDFWKEVLSKW